MRISSLSDCIPEEETLSLYDFGKSYSLRKSMEAEKEEGESLVNKARASVTRTTFEMMDRHTDMVKKSQELARERDKKLAIERRTQERREEQTALLTEMAIQNAERGKLLQSLYD